MTVDRGGLRYEIEVVDSFTGPIQDFRSQLRDLRRQTRTAQSRLNRTRRQQRQEARLSGEQGPDQRRLDRLSRRRIENDRRRQQSLNDGIRRRRRSLERLAQDEERQDNARARRIERLQARRERLERRRQRTLNDGIRRRERARRRLSEQAERAETRRINQLNRNQRSLERNERRIATQRRREQRRRLAAERRIARERQRAARGGVLATTGRGLRRGLIGAAASARRLFTVLVALAAIRLGAEIVAGAARAFVEFNAQLEQANLGVASLFTAVGQVTDATGRAAEGAQGLALAQGEARRQTALLRRDALTTAATFEDLLETFQTAIGPGLSAGLNVDEIRRFSVRISQAAAAIGLPQNQLAEEIRSLLQGTISARTTRIATSLGITNEDIRRAREAGTLVEFLNQRFSAFDAAAKESANTFAALSTNAVDAVRQILGFAGAETFEVLKEQLRDIFDALTDIDPITGELVPDPEVLDTVRVLFDGVTEAIRDFREQVSGISQQDIRGTFAALAALLRGTATAAGALVSIFSRFGEALVEVLDVLIRVGNVLQGSRIAQVFPGLDTLVGLTPGLQAVKDLIESTASSADGAASSFEGLGSAAAVTSSTIKGQSDAAIESLQKLTRESQAAASAGGGGAGGARRIAQINRVAEEQRNRLLQRRATLIREIDGLGNRDLRRRTVLGRLSAAEQLRVRGIVENSQELLEVGRAISEVEAQIAANQTARQQALQRGDLVQAGLLERNIRGFQAQLEALQGQRSAIEGNNQALLDQADNRARVLASVSEQLQIIAQISARQRELNDLVAEEDRLRRAQQEARRAAVIGGAGQSAERAFAAERAAQSRDQAQIDRLRIQNEERRLRLSNLDRSTQDDILVRRRAGLAIQQREQQLALRRNALVAQTTEQEAAALAQIQIARESGDQRQLQAAAQALLLARQRRDAAASLTSENDELTRQLEEQRDLELQVLRQQQNRAEQQRLQSELTGGQVTGGDPRVGQAAEAIFGTQQQQFEQAGQALGQTLSGIIGEAIAIEGAERGEILNSYESLFGAIGGIASRVLRNVFSTRGIFKILGSVFAPIGVIGGAAGFAKGGRIPGGKSFAASPAHFSRARGLADGGGVSTGRPAGLPASDTVPIWATPGEFMQPVSAVRRYGAGVMEAIRQGSVDPFALRALAGSRRTSVARPRMPAFQTGGEVSSNIQSTPAGPSGVGASVIVSSEDQLDNLLAGSGEAFLRYAQNNREDMRQALGL